MKAESDALTTIKCGLPTADRKVTSFVVRLSQTCDRSAASHYLSPTTIRHRCILMLVVSFITDFLCHKSIQMSES